MFCSCATLDWVVDCPREPCSHTASWIPITWEYGETTCQSFSFRVARTSTQGDHFSRQEYWSGLLFTWRRKWQLTPVFLPGESHGQRNLAGYTVHGVARVWRDWTTKPPPCYLPPLSNLFTLAIEVNKIMI